jgi:hypothetical protein
MRNIEIMLNDGVIGNKSVLLALSALTTGNLNAKLKQNAKPYKMEDILPLTHEYIVPPLTDEEKAAQAMNSLVAFVKTAPKVPKKIASLNHGG